jgi:hypothetical protein
VTRILISIVLPLLLPTLVYILWLAATRRAALAGPSAWQAMPWPWLVTAGVVLAGLLLYVVNVRIGDSGQGRYVPPQYIDGRVVPGHVVPADPARP